MSHITPNKLQDNPVGSETPVKEMSWTEELFCNLRVNSP